MTDGPLPFVIPSAGRGDTCTTPGALGEEWCTLVVPESEAPLYRDRWPNTGIVIHPDDMPGLCLKRNFILDRWPSVIMVDDDFTSLVHLEHGIGEKTHKLTASEAREALWGVAEDAYEYGAKLFGVASSVSPKAFTPAHPIRTTGWVNAGVTGILENPHLRYNPAIVGSDDFWISALNAYYYRKCWVDTRYAFFDMTGSGTFTTPGGAALVRTLETEKKDYELLRRYFGEAFRPRQNSNIKAVHEFQKTFTVPW